MPGDCCPSGSPRVLSKPQGTQGDGNNGGSGVFLLVSPAWRQEQLTLHQVGDVVSVQVLEEEACAHLPPSSLPVEGAGDGPWQVLIQEPDGGAIAVIGELRHHHEGEAIAVCPAGKKTGLLAEMLMHHRVTKPQFPHLGGGKEGMRQEMEGAMGLVSPRFYQHQGWKNSLWRGGKCPLCPKTCGPMSNPALPWVGHGAAPQLTHIWVMRVLLWNAFTSREFRMAETCGRGNRSALGEGRTALAQGEAEGRCRRHGRASKAALAFCSHAGNLAHGHGRDQHHAAGAASLHPCGSAGSLVILGERGCVDTWVTQAAMLPGVPACTPPRAHPLQRRTVPLTSPAVAFRSVLTRSRTVLRGRSVKGKPQCLASQEWGEWGWGSPLTGHGHPPVLGSGRKSPPASRQRWSVKAGGQAQVGAQVRGCRRQRPPLLQ